MVPYPLCSNLAWLFRTPELFLNHHTISHASVPPGSRAMLCFAMANGSLVLTVLVLTCSVFPVPQGPSNFLLPTLGLSHDLA